MVRHARGASLGGPPGPLLYNSRGGVWWVNGFLFFGPVLVPFDVAPQASSLLKVSSKSVDLTPCSHQVKPPYKGGASPAAMPLGHVTPPVSQRLGSSGYLALITGPARPGAIYSSQQGDPLEHPPTVPNERGTGKHREGKKIYNERTDGQHALGP